MDGAVFRYWHRVTYAECTMGNHVYYGRYLELLEAARGAFFRELGTSFRQWQEQGVIFPVVECHLRYHAPARYDDELSIAVWPGEVGRVRLRLEYRVENGAGALLVEGWTLHACAGLDEKPRRLPEALREQLLARVRPVRCGS
ncbi:MAG: acyl-CoA thioesterase [Verrucomicrobiae bacterium]|nr:acyl-CoA thioesterase [Verrucomicrobiae bacterium]